MEVIKRDGTIQSFDQQKIAVAVMKAGVPQLSAENISAEVMCLCEAGERPQHDVERVQDVVELCMMRAGHFEAARKYIVYRRERAATRVERRKTDPKAIGNFIHLAKYSRFDEFLERRETWLESVLRREAMDVRRWPELEELINEAFDAVRDKAILPSMRSMQFGGAAIEANNARLYNCSFSLADRPEFFSQMFFLLLAGCGVGYSVQKVHVGKLPKLNGINRKMVLYHEAQDSIEGWADCIKALIESYMTGDKEGPYVEFDWHKIRPLGIPLKTSGGLAPGHVPLKDMLEKVRTILNSSIDRKLKTLEVHDICCHIANCVLAGGIRRSSLIALFSPDDHDMMTCKTGKWFETDIQRQMANNSVVIVRQDAHKYRYVFDQIFEYVVEYGEPGFFFTPHPDYGCNPCGEIGLNPVCTLTGETGWAFCNLTEINATAIDTDGGDNKELFLDLCRHASTIGTLQAAYTDIPYLGAATKRIMEREALLGVSITGMMDNPEVLNPEWLQAGCRAVIEQNKYVADLIGINPCARATTIKPSGTASLLLNCVGSGIHPHHARRYLRRIVQNPIEPVFQYFKNINPHMCVKKPDGDWVIEFPVEVPGDAILVGDLTATAFMDIVFQVYENWVKPGTVDIMSSQGLTHNVSCTVTVGDDTEWDTVKEYAWSNRHRIAAMSFLPHIGDKVYPFAPREAIITAGDEARWNEILQDYSVVDWTQMVEKEDTTDPRGVGACEGGACLINEQ